MKLPGRNQWIAIAGGLVTLSGGLYAVSALPLESAQAFLDFAGPFSWKVIVGAIGASGGVKIAGLLKNGKQPPE